MPGGRWRQVDDEQTKCCYPNVQQQCPERNRGRCARRTRCLKQPATNAYANAYTKRKAATETAHAAAAATVWTHDRPTAPLLCRRLRAQASAPRGGIAAPQMRRHVEHAVVTNCAMSCRIARKALPGGMLHQRLRAARLPRSLPLRQRPASNPRCREAAQLHRRRSKVAAPQRCRCRPQHVLASISSSRSLRPNPRCS